MFTRMILVLLPVTVWPRIGCSDTHLTSNTWGRKTKQCSLAKPLPAWTERFFFGTLCKPRRRDTTFSHHLPFVQSRSTTRGYEDVVYQAFSFCFFSDKNTAKVHRMHLWMSSLLEVLFALSVAFLQPDEASLFLRVHHVFLRFHLSHFQLIILNAFGFQVDFSARNIAPSIFLRK